MWLEEYELLLRDPSPEAFQAAVRLKAENRPSSVFRYRQVTDTSLDSLRRGYVWLSHPQSFNDGYDSAAYVDFDHCMAVSFRRDVNSVIAEHSLSAAFSEADIRSIVDSSDPIATFGALLLREEGSLAGIDPKALLDGLSFVRRKQLKDLEEAIFEMPRRALLVCCFAASGAVPALWAHYAGNSSGFCIEYDVARLPPDDIRLRLLLPVIYGRAPADATFMFDAGLLHGPNSLTVRWPILAASYKDRHWSYEQEWRLVDPAGAHPSGGRAVPMPMKAVYLGPRITDEDAAKVRQAAQVHNLQVFRMQVGKDASTLSVMRPI